jgi:cytochrome c biogenesis protein CcdA
VRALIVIAGLALALATNLVTLGLALIAFGAFLYLLQVVLVVVAGVYADRVSKRLEGIADLRTELRTERLH